jgi:hypothetical protein
VPPQIRTRIRYSFAVFCLDRIQFGFNRCRSAAILASDKALDAGAKAQDLVQRGWRQAQHFVGPDAQRIHEAQRLVHAVLGIGRFLLEFGLGDQFAQQCAGGVELALLALSHNGAQQLPDIGRGLEILAPVTALAAAANQVPVQQLLEAVADVGACRAQGFADFVGIEGRP